VQSLRFRLPLFLNPHVPPRRSGDPPPGQFLDKVLPLIAAQSQVLRCLLFELVRVVALQGPRDDWCLQEGGPQVETELGLVLRLSAVGI
jgi:hypothetical protein